jgi:hypothetical protein
MLAGAIAVSFAGIALLLLFIVSRRWMRARFFRKRDALAARFRREWPELLTGTIPVTAWTGDRLAREVMESILLDRIEVAKTDELPAMVDCLRRSGLLDQRIEEARHADKWRRRAALVVLGRTRAPEAVPALAEGLDSADLETRIASVRGLGKAGLPEAAVPMLERFAGEEELEVPWGVLKNALLSCCGKDPGTLTHYLRVVQGSRRELLARVVAEVADNATCDELLMMAGDASAELRGSAARGLGRTTPEIALAPLSQLAGDEEWFVRLRAVVALGQFVDHGALPVLVRVLGDRNRLVRQRAAWALIRSRHLLVETVRQVVAYGDNYGLQAVVAELDRCGLYDPVLEELRKQGARDSEQLATALERARTRLSPSAPAATREKVEASVA